MALQYSAEVKRNFMNPKNMGEIKNPSGIGKVGNPACGDIMWVYIKVTKNKAGKEILADVKFRTFGCAAAIATSSMITQLAKKKTLTEAVKITTQDIASSLKGLPPIKMHCGSMASQGLKKAINDYHKKKLNPSKTKTKK